MPATLATPAPLEGMRLVVGIVNCQCLAAPALIGQIKLTRIHVLCMFLPGVRVKRDIQASLYDVERSGCGSFAGTTQPNLSLIIATYRSIGASIPEIGGA